MDLAMQQNRQSTGIPPPIDGDVFARQQRFLTLPRALQEDAKQFRAFVEQDKSRLFQTHHHALVKSVYSVKGKDLIDTIIQWLQAHYASANHAPVHTGPSPGLPAVGANRAASAQHYSAVTPASTKTHAHDVTKEQLQCAKKVAEALVLIGFITPYKDDSTHFSFIAPEHFVHDRDIDDELFIPVAPSVTELTTTSVWSVADGAVYARALKRKAGVLGQIDDGKDVYVVLNDYTKKAYLFASDLAREPISEMSGSTMSVRYDNSHFEFGVHVREDLRHENDDSELFNAETKELQEEFVNACLHIGAKYDKGGVKQMINAFETGLVGRDAIPGDQNKYLDLTTEPHEVTMASGAATSSISRRETERNPQTPFGVASTEAPTSKRYLNQQEMSDSPSTKNSGRDDRGSSLTSTSTHQKPSVGERVSAAMHGDRNDASYPATVENRGQRSELFPTSMEHHGHHHTGPHLTSSEHENRPANEFLTPSSVRQNQPLDDANSTSTSTTGEYPHQNRPTVGEKVSDALHGNRRDDGLYSTSTDHHDQPVGAYPTSTEHQHQNRSIGERVSEAVHGDRHDTAYPTSTTERYGHHSASTEYPNQHGGSYPIDAERQNRTFGEKVSDTVHSDRNDSSYPTTTTGREGDNYHGTGYSTTSPAYDQSIGSSYPTNEYQKPTVGERVGSAMHSGRHDSTGAYTSTSEDLHSHRQHGSSYPTSTEHQHQQSSAHPTTSMTGEHKKPSVGERLKSALHRDHRNDNEGSIPTTSEFQNNPVGAYPNPSQPHRHDHSIGGRSSTGYQNQQAGLYPPSAQQQNQTGDAKVNSKMHRDHHDDNAYQTSKKYEDPHADDAPDDETRLADVPTMTKHNENGVDVYYAPPVAP